MSKLKELLKTVRFDKFTIRKSALVDEISEDQFMVRAIKNNEDEAEKKNLSNKNTIGISGRIAFL